MWRRHPTLALGNSTPKPYSPLRISPEERHSKNLPWKLSDPRKPGSQSIRDFPLKHRKSLYNTNPTTLLGLRVSRRGAGAALHSHIVWVTVCLFGLSNLDSRMLFGWKTAAKKETRAWMREEVQWEIALPCADLWIFWKSENSHRLEPECSCQVRVKAVFHAQFN